MYEYGQYQALHRSINWAAGLFCWLALLLIFPAIGAAESSRISDEVIPIQEIPQRPATLDFGASFLSPGKISPPIELPTGAVWQPSLLFWGTLRSALQTFDNGTGGISEWANRLDLFGELRFTGTERIVLGIRKYQALHRSINWAAGLFCWLALLLIFPVNGAAESSRISDEVIPIQEIPQRPATLDFGASFLSPGKISPPIELPTGAVWQPSLLFWGTLRSALQTFDNGTGGISEWANRLDLFGELRFTGTERIVLGIRPLDRNNSFSGYNFHPDGKFFETFNGDIRTLFLEGEIGEIFPNLDRNDNLPLDIGFTVGRQPLSFQEGMLINVDSIDAAGITRDSLSVFGVPDFRITGLYAWNNIFRGNNRVGVNQEDSSANLFGLFTETDFSCCTVDLDLVYVSGGMETGDGFFAGLSSVQRIGHFNTSFRVNASVALDEETREVRDGVLLFSEISWTPPSTHDNLYMNLFWGINRFTSAARSPTVGGPLGRTGILFAAVGLGSYGAALGNQADNSVGGAVGYQWFFDSTRRQFIVEMGGRTNTDGRNVAAGAIGGRLQQALGQHFVIRLDSFYSYHQRLQSGYGARTELLVRF